MRHLILAGLAVQLLAVPAIAQTGQVAPASPTADGSVPKITAQETAKLPSIEAAAPSKTNTGMTTPPTPMQPASVPLPAAAPTGGVPGAAALTETQATRLIEAAGFSNVTGLAKGTDGFWRGKADKGAARAMVAVDVKGNVVTQ